MENTASEKNKRSKKIKIAIITIVLLLILGGTTYGYLKIPAFNSKVKNLIGKVPFSSPSKGEKSLTEREINDKINDLAEYYLSLDSDEAADKLCLIKKDDEILYNSIIKQMNNKSSTKTSEIIKLVRNLENRDNLLLSLYDELSRTKQNQLNLKLGRLENQDLLVTIKEIENLIDSDTSSREELVEIFNRLDEDILAKALYYLDEEYTEKVLSLLEDSKRSSVESQVLAISNDKLHLKDLANLYETKSLSSVVKEIGNTEQYTMEELGVIYSNLSAIKAAEILSNVNDDDFVKGVLEAIRREQNLNSTESTVDQITKAIEFVKEYDRKINDLVKVYEQMSPEKIAQISEKMINNDKTVTVLNLDSEPQFEVTDAMIITDVLSKLKDKTLSKVISFMSTDNAYKLTQMLAKP
jgi:flagellar motility protein MotE (MotC chaperone)